MTKMYAVFLASAMNIPLIFAWHAQEIALTMFSPSASIFYGNSLSHLLGVREIDFSFAFSSVFVYHSGEIN